MMHYTFVLLIHERQTYLLIYSTLLSAFSNSRIFVFLLHSHLLIYIKSITILSITAHIFWVD